MSLFVDEIDHEFIKALFPQYLLRQPIGYDLWKIYHQHKKLFYKLKSRGEIIPKNRFTFQNFKKLNKLPHSTRKDIWERLSQLGVLGTIPYDSTSDEYLLQVYKYFYSNDENDAKASSPSQQIPVSSRVGIELEVMNTVGIRDENTEDDADDNEENSENHEFADFSDILPTDSDEIEGNTNDDHCSSENQSDEAMTYYPPLPDSKNPPKSKDNFILNDIYKNISYPLPYRWVLQPNNSLLIARDGFTYLKPNPNWQGYVNYDRSGPIVNSRLRTSLGNNSKQEWVSTWTDTFVNHKRVAIFYFEITILSVTSCHSGQSSNLILGFKEWSKISNSSETLERNESTSRFDIHGNPTSINRQSSTIHRSSLDGTRNNLQIGHLDKGVFVYYGSDGYISDGLTYKPFSKSFGIDDVVGCGVNFVQGSIFFTKNGVFMGNAFNDIFNLDLAPFISLRSGNSLRTNFGLHEEFVFDIDGYQSKWKSKAYQYVFGPVNGINYDDGFDINDDSLDEDGIDVEMAQNENQNVCLDKKEFLLSNDERFEGNKLYKPNIDKLNNLSSNNDSLRCTLNSIINGYLIHEGLIDVAKGFLKDLQKDCIDDEEEHHKIVIRHNERQIIKEEENLKTRHEIRVLINEGKITECIKYIELKFPGLLMTHIDLMFELKIADYLLTILMMDKNHINEILEKGEEICQEFIYNDQIDRELKERFQSQFGEISALIAYDNPFEECNKSLSFYLTPSYLQERLFQLVNNKILKHLEKNSESSLESVVSYTRAMIQTLMEFDDHGNPIHNNSELQYYKLVNIDEDLLRL